MGSNFTQPLDLTQSTALALTLPLEKSLDILELLEVFRSQRTPNREAKPIGMGSNFTQPLDIIEFVEVFRSRRTPNGEAKPIGIGSNFTQPLYLTQGTALALTPP